MKLWIKPRITKYFLVLLSPCQLIPLSFFFFQKHSSARGWWGTFESTKTQIPACIWLHPATNHILKKFRERVSWVCENVGVQHNQKATVDSVFMWKQKNLIMKHIMWSVVTTDEIHTAAVAVYVYLCACILCGILLSTQWTRIETCSFFFPDNLKEIVLFRAIVVKLDMWTEKRRRRGKPGGD